MYQNDDFATGYAVGRDSSNNNNGGFGNGWEGLIGLALVASLFGGGWGFGGGFGGNRGFGGFGGGCGSNCATQADLANGFAQNTLQRGIDDIILGQAQMQNFINQGFSGLNNTFTTGINSVNTGLCNLGFNLQNSLNGISREIGDCCCKTNNNITSGFAELNYNLATNTCNIIRANENNTRQILDFLTNEKISSLQAENSGLKAQISNDKQSAYLISQLKEPCPIPAFITPNPHCCYNACGTNIQ